MLENELPLDDDRGMEVSELTDAPQSGLDHIGIFAREWEQSVAFYEDALGFSTKLLWGEAPGRCAYLDSGDGTCIELFENPALPPAADPPELIPHICLRTNDVDAAHERLVVDHGASSVWEPRDVTLNATDGDVVVRLCFVRGPAGEVIELLQGIAG